MIAAVIYFYLHILLVWFKLRNIRIFCASTWSSCYFISWEQDSCKSISSLLRFTESFLDIQHFSVWREIVISKLRFVLVAELKTVLFFNKKFSLVNMSALILNFEAISEWQPLDLLPFYSKNNHVYRVHHYFITKPVPNSVMLTDSVQNTSYTK